MIDVVCDWAWHAGVAYA